MGTKLTWTNPTQTVDNQPYDAATLNGGYNLALDGTVVVSLPFAFGTSFDMKDLAAYKSLKSGNHTAALQVVTKLGEVSAFSAPASFSVNPVPNAPSGLTLV